MPRYDYQCEKCGRKWESFHSIDERDNEKCCGKEATRLITMGAVDIWKPMWYNDICEEPIYIESKRQLKEECKKHDVIAARLL